MCLDVHTIYEQDSESKRPNCGPATPGRLSEGNSASSKCLPCRSVPIDVVEHLADLLLSPALAVQSAGQALAFVLLIAQDRQYLRMKVAIPVSGYTECKSPSLTVGVTHSVPVSLITRHCILSQVFAPFSDHHALNHYLQQVL